MTMPMKAVQLLVPVMLLATGACARGEHLNGSRSPHPKRTPRSSYSATARADAAAVAAWDAAGSAALRSELVVQPSFREILAFPSGTALAAAYRFQLRRGERVEIDVRTERGEHPFADVFEVINEDMYRHVYAAERGASRFSYTATMDGEHILRFQPPVGGDARYAVRVSGSARYALTFPVSGEGPSAIAGQWGDARDGGARSHKGVDIFASRGTPVVAVASGTITSVETTGTGGRVVWERDDTRGLLYYYAHLDEQRVEAGRRVNAGDIIGTVGNTGNASGGSPHLHFGVFLPGYVAQNPAPFLTSNTSSLSVATDGEDGARVPEELGSKVRLAGDHVRLRASPGEGGAVIDQLSAGTEMLVIGYVNGWNRVVLDSGRTGFIAGWLVGGERSAGERK